MFICTVLSILEIKFTLAKRHSLLSIRGHVIRIPSCLLIVERQIGPKLRNDCYLMVYKKCVNINKLLTLTSIPKICNEFLTRIWLFRPGTAISNDCWKSNFKGAVFQKCSFHFCSIYVTTLKIRHISCSQWLFITWKGDWDPHWFPQ